MFISIFLCKQQNFYQPSFILSQNESFSITVSVVLLFKLLIDIVRANDSEFYQLYIHLKVGLKATLYQSATRPYIPAIIQIFGQSIKTKIQYVALENL